MYGGGGVAVGRGGAGEVPEVLIVQVWFSAAVWKTSLHSLCNKLQFIYLTSQLVRSCLMKVKMKQKVNILLLWSERRPTVCWQRTVIGYWNKNKTHTLPHFESACDFFCTSAAKDQAEERGTAELLRSAAGEPGGECSLFFFLMPTWSTSTQASMYVVVWHSFMGTALHYWHMTSRVLFCC